MGTSALYIEQVEAAVVKGGYHILAEDGTVRTYDHGAGYFCRSSNSPSARAVKAAFTAGRTGTVRISCDG